MNEQEILYEKIAAELSLRKGILATHPLLDHHKPAIMQIEKDAQSTSFMGFGVVINTGVNEVMEYDAICVALTGMFFESSQSSLVLKKGDVIVGEDIPDKQRLARMKAEEDIWLIGGTFAVYKTKINFPHDMAKRLCRFETPSLKIEPCSIKDKSLLDYDLIIANPTRTTDLYLKEQYFNNANEDGAGTILIGARRIKINPGDSPET